MPGESIFIELTGRLVQGDPWTRNTKGYQGAVLQDKQGNPKSEIYIAVAVPKEPNGNANAIYAAIYAKGQQDFPAGEWQSPSFHWKVEDGDAGKHVGKAWAAGCIIFKLKTNFEVNCYDQSGQQIVDPQQLKRGAYVRVSVGVVGNGLNGTANAGLYLNLGRYVQLVGYGEEIAGGLSFEQTFPTAPVLPFGASATPVASGPALAVPGQPAAFVPMGVPGAGAPAPVATAPVAAPQATAAPPAAGPAPIAGPVGAPPAAIGAPTGIQGLVPLGAPAGSQIPPVGPPAPGVPAVAVSTAVPAASGAPMPGTLAAPAVAPTAAAPTPIAPPPGFMQPGAAAPAAAAAPGQPPPGWPAPIAPTTTPPVGYAQSGQPLQPIGHDAAGQPIFF